MNLSLFQLESFEWTNWIPDAVLVSYWMAVGAGVVLTILTVLVVRATRAQKQEDREEGFGLIGG